MTKDEYKRQLRSLQIALAALQHQLIAEDRRLLVIDIASDLCS